jgi:hypothetical protein
VEVQDLSLDLWKLLKTDGKPLINGHWISIKQELFVSCLAWVEIQISCFNLGNSSHRL